MSEESKRTTTRPGSEVAKSGQDGAGERSPDRIVADIEQTRDRLAGTIDEITVRVAPKNVARKGADSLRAQFLHPDGSPRVERVAPIAGVVALIALVRVIRALRSRR